MGFSGTFLVARADRPLTELSALRAVDASPCWSAGDGPWQILQLSPIAEPDDSIVTETAAPVLVLHVQDSDFAGVRAVSPGGPVWHCVLSPETARDYDVPERWIGEPDEVTDHAVAWAEEAGLRPDRAAVRAVLEAESDPFAEDLVVDLVHALGFRFDAGRSLHDPR
ncbi:hypothetical protein [Kitasatospora sp. NPDC047058]|uniref:hypothetical protein n=1 Tax=Kitasatospora sp. NPDC047058 TaxID=3155620 RepID=UPI00340BB82D